MIKVKEVFNNGVFDCLKIYDNEFKIKSLITNYTYNTDENHPLVIKASNFNKYKITEEKIDEIKNVEEND